MVAGGVRRCVILAQCGHSTHNGTRARSWWPPRICKQRTRARAFTFYYYYHLSPCSAIQSTRTKNIIRSWLVKDIIAWAMFSALFTLFFHRNQLLIAHFRFAFAFSHFVFRDVNGMWVYWMHIKYSAHSWICSGILRMRMRKCKKAGKKSDGDGGWLTRIELLLLWLMRSRESTHMRCCGAFQLVSHDFGNRLDEQTLAGVALTAIK